MSSGKEYVVLAPAYDAVFEPLLRRVRECIVEMIPSRARVLEVACGTGAQAVRLRRINAEYTGVDLSPSMLRRAGTKNVNCREADGRNLPYAGGEFDAATISLALHEMEPEVRDGVAGELVRVLRPGGVLIVADYTLPSPDISFGRLFKGGIGFIERLAGGSHYRNYREFMQLGGLRAYLERLGMTVVNDKPFFRDNIAVMKLRRA